MQIINDNGVLKVVNNGTLLYTAMDLADAKQFIISYVEPVLPIIDTSDQDFIPAEGE